MPLENKKILFVSPTLTGGGAERVVSILTTALARSGMDICLLLNERCESEYHVDGAVKIYTIPEEIHKKKSFLGKLLRIQRRYIITKQINPDVTITFLNDAIQFFCNLPLKGKFISTVRIDPRYGNAFQKILKYVIVGLSDACLVQNNEQKQYFGKQIQKKIAILPNPLPKERFVEKVTVREEIYRIITLGRLTKQKNHQLLINAFDKVKANNKKLILEIYGEGEERNNLENLIEKLDLSDCVFLKGRTKDPKKCLMGADLFVLSSDFEGMPNALLEAMAAGVPCISTDCPTGPSDIIENGVSGILVKKNSIDELAQAIESMIESKKRKEMAINAYNYVLKNYAVDHIVECLCKELENVLE